jgi:hypothetical protein
MIAIVEANIINKFYSFIEFGTQKEAPLSCDPLPESIKKGYGMTDRFRRPEKA